MFAFVRYVLDMALLIALAVVSACLRFHDPVSFVRGSLRLARHERYAKGLSGTDRMAVDLAIELERAQLLFPATAVLNLCFFYGVAGGLWSFAIRTKFIWGALGGIALGLAVAFTICAYPIFAKIGSVQQVQDRQLFVGKWVKLGIILGGFGLVVWGGRSLLGF